MKLTFRVEQGQFTDLAFDPAAQLLFAVQNHSDVAIEVRPNWQTPKVKYDVLPHCCVILRSADTLMQVGATAGPAHGEIHILS
jgi:hypothetical protein